MCIRDRLKTLKINAKHKIMRDNFAERYFLFEIIFITSSLNPINPITAGKTNDINKTNILFAVLLKSSYFPVPHKLDNLGIETVITAASIFFTTEYILTDTEYKPTWYSVDKKPNKIIPAFTYIFVVTVFPKIIKIGFI